MDNKIAKSFIPGLIINVTDSCNFMCPYCPPYGENLNKGLTEFDLDSIISIILIAKQYNVPQVRLTGGEPFLQPQRLKKILAVCGNDFKRLVVNTNGSLLHDHFKWLLSYKDSIVLKISLDTLDEGNFKEFSNVNSFSIVYKNLCKAIAYGFNIEINTVLYNQTIYEIIDLIEFTVKQKINLKFLTTSSFYGFVESNKSSYDLEAIIEYLEEHSKSMTNEHLVGERGAPMLVYQIDESKITIFDSRLKGSKTPSKCYFKNCVACPKYPCDYGVFSISISTDGIMTVCRGRKDLGENIFFRSNTELNRIFYEQLKQFNNCFEINVNSIK